ncbi:hypothetical protein ACNS7O_08585 [Haloferacaceae archaeon DSL9]
MHDLVSEFVVSVTFVFVLVTASLEYGRPLWEALAAVAGGAVVFLVFAYLAFVAGSAFLSLWTVDSAVFLAAVLVVAGIGWLTADAWADLFASHASLTVLCFVGGFGYSTLVAERRFPRFGRSADRDR